MAGGWQNTGAGPGREEGFPSPPCSLSDFPEWRVMNGFIKQISESDMNSGRLQQLLRLAWPQSVSAGPLLMASTWPPLPVHTGTVTPMEGNPDAILEAVWVALSPLQKAGKGLRRRELSPGRGNW